MSVDPRRPVHIKNSSAREYVKAYEEWYRDHPAVFSSEVQALKSMFPSVTMSRGIEIGTATGIFSEALGVKQGIESSALMRKLAAKRGIEVTNATATDLPYTEHFFDYVFLNLCNPFVYSMYFAFSEAYRVLKPDGSFIVCFMERESAFSKYCISQKANNLYLYFTNFFSTQKILFELSEAGFRQLNVVQTLFNSTAELPEVEMYKPGYGEGSFIVVKAIKNKKLKGTSYNTLLTGETYEKNSLSN